MKITFILLALTILIRTAHAGEHSQYVTIAVSQTQQKLGTGKIGNKLERLVCTVATAATSTVSLYDSSGATAIPVMAATTAIGVYTVHLGIRAKGVTTAEGFYVTTGAGVSCIAIGSFGTQIF